MSQQRTTREGLFRGINILLPPTGANLGRMFPFTTAEMLRDRGTLLGAFRRWWSARN